MVQDKGCFMYMSTGSLQSYLRVCMHTHTQTQVMRRALEEKRALCVQHSGKDSLSR